VRGWVKLRRLALALLEICSYRDIQKFVPSGLAAVAQLDSCLTPHFQFGTSFQLHRNLTKPLLILTISNLNTMLGLAHYIDAILAAYLDYNPPLVILLFAASLLPTQYHPA
jgi:hypothetical protein